MDEVSDTSSKEDLLKVIESLQSELKSKNEIITRFKVHLDEVEKQLAKYKTDNKSLKEELAQKRFYGLKEGIDLEEEEDQDVETKIDYFLKAFPIPKRNFFFLQLLSINYLSSVHHLNYCDGKEQFTEVLEQNFEPLPHDCLLLDAAKLSFIYSLKFFEQTYMKSFTELVTPEMKVSLEFSYPLNWLLNRFPCTLQTLEKTINLNNFQVFHPLHFLLAVESDVEDETYRMHLELFLQTFGPHAFLADVSPLSVTVAKPNPLIDVVAALVQYYPASVSKEDEDGSIPIMHACACNDTDIDEENNSEETSDNLSVIKYLFRLDPETINTQDNFGCSSIHYASFSGCVETVRFILLANPNSALLVEGNGATPLHDAVQNRRYCQFNPAQNPSTYSSRDIKRHVEMVQLLLNASKSAAKIRDDFGAFPLHRAARWASLEVVKIVFQAFPKAMFAADKEGLLPIHYYSQRDKQPARRASCVARQDLNIIQFILQENPHSKVLSEEELMAETPGTKSGGWIRGFARWAGGSNNDTAKNETAQTTSMVTSTSVPEAPKRETARRNRGSVYGQYNTRE